MTFEDEFGDWLAFATVSAEAYQGASAWGDDPGEFGAAVPVPAWFDFQERKITTADGSVVVSSTILFASTQYRPQFAPGSRVTIPGQADKYRVVRCRSWPGDDTHLEVDLL